MKQWRISLSIKHESKFGASSLVRAVAWVSRVPKASQMRAQGSCAENRMARASRPWSLDPTRVTESHT